MRFYKLFLLLNQATGRSYCVNFSSTPKVNANNAIRTNTPFCACLKIAKLSKSFKSISNSLASGRESRGRGVHDHCVFLTVLLVDLSV